MRRQEIPHETFMPHHRCLMPEGHCHEQRQKTRHLTASYRVTSGRWCSHERGKQPIIDVKIFGYMFVLASGKQIIAYGGWQVFLISHVMKPGVYTGEEARERLLYPAQSLIQLTGLRTLVDNYVWMSSYVTDEKVSVHSEVLSILIFHKIRPWRFSLMKYDSDPWLL